MTGETKLPLSSGQTAYAITPQGREGESVPHGCDLTLADIAGLYLNGMRRIVIGGPNAAAIRAVVARMNALLSSRDLPEIRATKPARADLLAWQGLSEDAAQVDTQRRGLLTRIAAPVTEAVEAPDAAPPLAQVQGINAENAGVLFAWAPDIDPTICTGCDACLSVCPEDVLIRRKDGTGDLCYHIEATGCTGCGLCVEVCDANAVSLVELAEALADIALDAFVCRACGVSVHEPRGRDTGDGLCRICRQTGHHKKLFQVLT